MRPVVLSVLASPLIVGCASDSTRLSDNSTSYRHETQSVDSTNLDRIAGEKDYKNPASENRTTSEPIYPQTMATTTREPSYRSGNSGMTAPQGSVNNSSNTNNSSNSASYASAVDAQFIREASTAGHSEVELGQLAVRKGSDARVRQLGQRMVDDHQKANQELSNIANTMNAAPPAPADKPHQYEDLSDLPGANFDRRYVEHMLQEHQKAINLFEKQAREGSSPALRNFAQRTLPTLRDHLSNVQALASSMGISTSATTAR